MSAPLHAGNSRNPATRRLQTAHSMLVFTAPARLWCSVPAESKDAAPRRPAVDRQSAGSASSKHRPCFYPILFEVLWRQRVKSHKNLNF